jgi:hypothetical protein
MLDAPLFWAVIGLVALIGLCALLARRRGHDPTASDWSGYGRQTRSARLSPETEASHMPLSARMFPGAGGDAGGDGGGDGGGSSTN